MGSHHNSLLPEGRTASGQAVLGHTRCGFRCVSGTLVIDRVISWEGWAQRQVPRAVWVPVCFHQQAGRIKFRVSEDLVSIGTGRGYQT